MDNNIKKIYYILLGSRSSRGGSASTSYSGNCVKIHLRWTACPTNYASAVFYHNYPKKRIKRTTIKLEKVCQERKE